jgi:hypothetical protein
MIRINMLFLKTEFLLKNLIFRNFILCRKVSTSVCHFFIVTTCVRVEDAHYGHPRESVQVFPQLSGNTIDQKTRRGLLFRENAVKYFSRKKKHNSLTGSCQISEEKRGRHCVAFRTSENEPMAIFIGSNGYLNQDSNTFSQPEISLIEY